MHSKKGMLNWALVILCVLFMFNLEVFARRGGGSFGGSRSSRSSWGSSSRSTKKSSWGKSTKSKAKSTKAISKNKLDRKQQKMQAPKDNAAAKKYGNKATATKAYRDKLASSNKYDSPTAPTKKPDNIPQNVTVNNTTVNTSYGMLPGGGYGYGYMDPVTNMFVAVAAHQMLVDAHTMRMAGYGHWGADGQPIVYDPISPLKVLFWLVIGILAIAVIALIIKWIED